METLCRSDSSWFIQQEQNTKWTKEENKKFESALALFDEKTPNRWFKVAEMIPGKSVFDVINHYKELVADVCDIEAGLVPIPGYLASPSFGYEFGDIRGFNECKKRSRTCDGERKKGVPWTEEEHRRFLLGLQKHGKGDWRNISRNFVVSKTPTQVASHAQKYYLRQLSGGKDKRRPSIHDITTHHLPNPSDNNKLLADKPTSASKVMANWNPMNCENLTFFNSSCVNPFIAYPGNVDAKSCHGANAGSSVLPRF